MLEAHNLGVAGETVKLYDSGSGRPSALPPIRPSIANFSLFMSEARAGPCAAPTLNHPPPIVL